MRRLSAFALIAIAPSSLAACGSDTPPPLTGNVTDARGAHAGSFRAPDSGGGDYGNTAAGVERAGGNAQGNPQ